MLDLISLVFVSFWGGRQGQGKTVCMIRKYRELYHYNTDRYGGIADSRS